MTRPAAPSHCIVRRGRAGAAAIMAACLVSASLAGDSATPSAVDQPAAMHAHFIDVGQASAALLEFPCGAALIDCGVDWRGRTELLTEALDAFFKRRSDLNQTLGAVFVTHANRDHAGSLLDVAHRYNVSRYFDNSRNSGTGEAYVAAFHARPGAAKLHRVTDIDVTKAGSRGLLCDDGIACSGCDPSFRVLASSASAVAGWTAADVAIEGNHSMVVRIDFGKASLLLPGGVRKAAVSRLADRYSGTTRLDVDLLAVPSRGGPDSVTEALLRAVSPEVAVVQCGKWDEGKDDPPGETAWSLGHPRKSTLELLERFVRAPREEGARIWAADAATCFDPVPVRRGIYATSASGTVVVELRPDGVLRVACAR